MSENISTRGKYWFVSALILAGGGFALFFIFYVLPPLIANPDIVGAFAAGFVNPYSTGYSVDVILCWVILAVWVVYERQRYRVRFGWVALVLGIVPGVATGFALYLLLRMKYVDGLAHK